MEQNNKIKMQYRHLGKTGLKISAISYGFMLEADEALMTELVKEAYESGVNFFDNAEFYGNGKVETLFGKTLKTLNIPRENLIISTKIFWGGVGMLGGSTPNEIGLSRKHIIEGAMNSLKRLQLDYVDLIFAHRPDDETPVEETCRAFDWLIKNGKVLYWGTSMWPAKKIWQAIGICEKLGLEKPVVEQPEYNMLARTTVESDYAELFDEHGLGTTVYSPLCGGILAGRYNKEMPKDSRYETIAPHFKAFYDLYLGPANIEKTREMCLKIEEVAKEIGASMAQLSLAWVLKNKDVSTALMGASRVSQLRDNLIALSLIDKITPEIEEKIESIIKTKPNSGFSVKTFKPNLGRR